MSSDRTQEFMVKEILIQALMVLMFTLAHMCDFDCGWCPNNASKLTGCHAKFKETWEKIKVLTKNNFQNNV
jgi:hypothetical protein